MVTASLEPRLMGSKMSDRMMRLAPLMQSSMYMKLRVCVPLPPAITVLGLRGIGVFLLQRGSLKGFLLIGIVDTRGRGIKIAAHAKFLGRLQHVGVDQHGKHAKGFIVFDEAHAAHIRGEIVD